jgi:predicted 3-demethylubiquinone-9 3-methyltransferase (glyoxalase superfamily)
MRKNAGTLSKSSIAARLDDASAPTMEEQVVQIIPSLWFNNNLEEALDFYRTVFKSVEMGEIVRAGPDGPGPEGSIIAGTFTLDGNRFEGINGGPGYPFTQAVSFVIRCKDQAEVDHYWQGLSANGGKEIQCGWLTDPFGIPWQIVPEALYRTVGGSDKAGGQRAMAAMMKMVKLDVAELERAYEGA